MFDGFDKPQASQPFALVKLFGVGERAAHVVDVFFRGASGTGGIAIPNGVGDRLVLLQQLVPCPGVVVEPATIVEDAVLEQPVARPQRVQHHDIMGSFPNRMMEFDIQQRFCGHVLRLMSLVHLPDDLVKPP